MAKNFQLVAGHVALDFANTLDWRYVPDRRVELVPSYERFIAFSHQSGVITAAQASALLGATSAAEAERIHAKVIELRETLYALFLSVVSGKKPGSQVVQKMNDFLAQARVVDTIHWQHGSVVRTHDNLDKTPDGPLWPILEAAVSLLTSPQVKRVRECNEGKCRWLFLDTSRNQSRRWCDMQICGNRVKAQRFYARTRK